MKLKIRQPYRLAAFFAAEQHRHAEIQTLLDEVAQIDAEIDEKVLDLYGITDPGDRQRILGNAAVLEDDEADSIEDTAETGGEESE
jgi:type I restriction enzyme M protein